MASTYNDFGEVQKAISEGSGDVSSSLGTYQRYAKEIARSHPELAYELSRLGEYGSVGQIKEAWRSLADKIPDNSDLAKHESEILNGLLLAREMEHVQVVDQDAYSSSPPQGTGKTRATHKPSAMGEAIGTAIASPGALFKRNKFMESDSEFHSTEEGLKTEWYKKREDWIKDWEKKEGLDEESFNGDKKAYQKAAKEFRKKHWENLDKALQQSEYSKDNELDYFYGSLGSAPIGPDGNPLRTLTLEDDAREAFSKTLEGRRFLAWNYGKRKLERYNRNQRRLEEKVYKDPAKDPHVAALKQKIAAHQRARLLREYEKLSPEIRKKLSFEKFLYSKDYAKLIAGVRHQVAQSEWDRWEHSKADPSKKISQKKLDAYKQYRTTHIKSFAYSAENHRRPFSFFRRFLIPNFGGGGYSDGGGGYEDDGGDEGGGIAPSGDSGDGGGAAGEPSQQPQKKKKKRSLADLAKKAKKTVDRAKKTAQGIKSTAQLIRALIQMLVTWISEGISNLLELIGWQGLVAIIGALAIVILVLWLLSLFGPEQTIQINCGDDKITKVPKDREISGLTDYLKSNLFIDYFAMDYKDPSNPVPISDGSSYKGNEAAKATENTASTICLLFGHTKQDSAYSSDKYINPFGTYIVGTDKQGRADDGRGDAYAVAVFTEFDDSSDSCIGSYSKHSGEGTYRLEIRIKNPDKCSSIYQFQFVLAQQLGYALIDQQKNLDSKQKLFNSFKNPPGPFNNPYFLPTGTCLPTSGTIDISKQPSDCFADMVGSYLTYPFYFYSGGTTYVQPTEPPTPTPIIPEATITIIQGRLSITPQPTSPPITPTVNSPLSDFPTGKFEDYYLFAYNNLFNKIDFFSDTKTSTGKINYATQLTRDVQSACATPGDSGTTSYGVYYVKVTSANATTCLSRLRTKYGDPVINQMLASADDPNNGYKLQCIGFSQATSIGFDGASKGIQNCLIRLPGWAESDSYTVSCPSSIPYTFIPSKGNPSFNVLPGDFALFKFSKWGHIAFVISTKQSTSTGKAYTFTVSEANGADGSVDISPTYHVDKNLIGVLRHN